MDITMIPVLIGQSCLNALFLACFYPSRNMARNFSIFLALFVFVLYPLNSSPLANRVILRNVINVLILFVAVKLVLKDRSWKQVLFLVLLYEISQIISALVSIGLTSMIVKDFDPIYPVQIAPYYLCTILMGAIQVYTLKWLSRSFSLMVRFYFFYTMLSINIILTLLCGVGALIPSIRETLSLDYGPSLMVMTLLNLLAFADLSLGAKKDEEIQVTQKTKDVFDRQAALFIQEEKKLEQVSSLHSELERFAPKESQLRDFD